MSAHVKSLMPAGGKSRRPAGVAVMFPAARHSRSCVTAPCAVLFCGLRNLFVTSRGQNPPDAGSTELKVSGRPTQFARAPPQRPVEKPWLHQPGLRHICIIHPSSRARPRLVAKPVPAGRLIPLPMKSINRPTLGCMSGDCFLHDAAKPPMTQPIARITT